MLVSLIVTIKNEAVTLDRLLDSIAAQSCPPDEIVIVDGGSSDDTLDRLRARAERLPIKIIAIPGANISQGRNTAIRAASNEIICATDAGVRLDEHWLEELLKPFDRARNQVSPLRGNLVSADVVSGFFLPDPRGAFETALAATTLPALADIRAETFQPSSRSVAFRKTAWARVNGYPEWLDYCEDLVFDFALRAAGCHFAFAPNARAYFRPRENLRGFFKQYYHYARGDGKANLFFKRHLVRYATYFIALPVVIALTILAPLAALPLWMLSAAFMFFTPYKRLLRLMPSLTLFDQIGALAWVPLIRITGDVAKMLGYPVGARWRSRNRRGA